MFFTSTPPNIIGESQALRFVSLFAQNKAFQVGNVWLNTVCDRDIR